MIPIGAAGPIACSNRREVWPAQAEVFRLAGKALSEQQKTELAAEYADDMDRRRAAV